MPRRLAAFTLAVPLFVSGIPSQLTLRVTDPLPDGGLPIDGGDDGGTVPDGGMPEADAEGDSRLDESYDATLDASEDGSTDAAGTAGSANDSTNDESGCDCRTGGTQGGEPPRAAWWLVALTLLLRRTAQGSSPLTQRASQ